MNSLDRRLLEILQKDARTPIARLSEEANASTASVQRRLKKMREDGTIISENVVIDQEKAGFDVTAIISVDLERDRIDEIDAFKRRAKMNSQVQHCYCVAGDCDFVLVVIAKSIKDYEAFTHQFFFKDTSVRRFRTSIVVSREKTTTYVPLQETV